MTYTRSFFSARVHSDHVDRFINLFILSTNTVVEVNNFFPGLPADRSQMCTQVRLVRTIAKERRIPDMHLTELHIMLRVNKQT